MRNQLLFNVHRTCTSLKNFYKSDNFVNENKTTSGNGKTAYQGKESTVLIQHQH